MSYISQVAKELSEKSINTYNSDMIIEIVDILNMINIQNINKYGKLIKFEEGDNGIDQSTFEYIINKINIILNTSIVHIYDRWRSQELNVKYILFSINKVYKYRISKEFINRFHYDESRIILDYCF